MKFEVDEAWLINQNQVLRKSSADIAADLGTTKAVVKNLFKKFHLKIQRHYDLSQQKLRQTNLEKYGVECTLQDKKVRSKSRKTCLEKYGVDCVTKSQVIQDKIKQTLLERYGTTSTFQSPVIREKIKQTLLERYGVDNPLKDKKIFEKVKQTNLEKYGVEYLAQNQEIRAKQKDTCLEKYGHKCSLQNDEVRIKSKNTSVVKYGVEYPMQSDEVQNKQKRTNIERHGVDYPLRLELVKNKRKATLLDRYGTEHQNYINISKETLENLNDRNWLIDQHHNQQKTLCQIGRELNVSDSFVRTQCVKYDVPVLRYGFSGEEKEVLNYIKSIYDGVIEETIRNIISPHELDIYLPDKKLAIEYDGIFWHSFDQTESINEKNYHLTKTLKCEQKGIQLLHIFSNEWTDPGKQQIWKSIIASKLGRHEQSIFARKCQIKLVNNSDTRIFLEANHLQGHGISKVNLGLYYDDVLVSLMTFGKSRFNKNYEWELVRFCSQLNTKIIGGASKLLKYFVRTYAPKSIISYADRRHSTGGLYEATGFKRIRVTKPNYFYFKNNTYLLESRIKFQKHKLANILLKFDSGLTESQNMFNNDYRRIWDCGNLVYVLEY